MLLVSLETIADNTPQKVIVAGKVINYDSRIPLTLLLNRVGVKREEADIKIDENGNFHAVFETYVPLDAYLTYKTNFLIQLNPKDSLHVTFDGNAKDRPELLSAVQFNGNDAKTNQFIAKFQQKYYSNEIYYDWDKKKKAIKEYQPEEYIKYNDSILYKSRLIYDEFVKEFMPNEKSKQWASFFIDEDYYSNIAFYAGDHRDANNFGWDNYWTVPDGFYEKINNKLPITRLNLMNGYTLGIYADRFKYYVYEKLKADRKEDSDWNIFPNGGLGGVTNSYDSVSVFGIIKHVPDVLLKEIMLTQFFQGKFETQDIAPFEKYMNVIQTHIQEPFLIGPLYQNYLKTKSRIEQPQLYSKTIFKDVQQSTVTDFFNDILETNKGKVIYLDFWATWCGPCLAEFPNSKKIEKELEDEDISFVYICVESDKEKALATVAQYQLGGQHYYLSRTQSKEIMKLFEIQGIPFYTLIDQQGVITEKGNHLRPLVAKEKIKELLQ